MNEEKQAVPDTLHKLSGKYMCALVLRGVWVSKVYPYQSSFGKTFMPTSLCYCCQERELNMSEQGVPVGSCQ